MSYRFMSNIHNFDEFNNPEKAYISVSTDDVINFTDANEVNQKASFLMVRAHKDNDLLIQILPYNYGVYVPATELWSVDSLSDINGITIKKSFQTTSTSVTELPTGKIQWMIGYK